jgi:hypothetical protein
MKTHTALRVALLAGIAILAFSLPAAWAAAPKDCWDQTGSKQIEACSTYLQKPGGKKQDRAEAHYLRGLGYLTVGDYESAKKEFTQAANLAGSKSKIGQAAGSMVRIHDTSTADGNYNMALGATEPQEGRDTAFFVERALAIDPNHGASRFMRGYQRYKQNDLEGAVKDLEIAVPNLKKERPEDAQFAAEILAEARSKLLALKNKPSADMNAKRAAEAAALNDKNLCTSALNGKRTDFELDPNFRILVEEARKRSLDVAKCVDLLTKPTVETTKLLERARLLLGDLDAYAKSAPAVPLSSDVVRAALALHTASKSTDGEVVKKALDELDGKLSGNADALGFIAAATKKREGASAAMAARTEDEARLLAAYLQGFASTNLTDDRSPAALAEADGLLAAGKNVTEKSISSAVALLAELNLLKAYSDFKSAQCSSAKTPAC